jgi:hypothetical protein
MNPVLGGDGRLTGFQECLRRVFKKPRFVSLARLFFNDDTADRLIVRLDGRGLVFA